MRSDLEDEASDAGRGPYWIAAQQTVTGVRLRRFLLLDALMADGRYAVRSLVRTPGYTLAALVTFTLGIGVNIAVLSVVDRMMFRPLPYGNAGELVHLQSLVRTDAFPEANLTLATITALRQRARSFSGVAIAETNERTTTIDGFGEPARLSPASYDLLDVLQVAPIAGRDLAKTDVDSSERLILLTEEEWQRRFDRATDIFDRTFASVGGRPITYRVVGILPAGFLVPSSGRAEHVDGLMLSSLRYDEEVSEALLRELGPSAVARLAPGVSLEQAQAEVNLIAAQMATDFPDARMASLDVALSPVRHGLFQFYRSYAWLIVAGVALVLMVACVNLAALLLARGRGREHAVAIRVALGASSGRILRLVMIEAAVLCGLSAAIALVAAQAVFQVVLALVPAGLRGVASEPLDARLIGIALVVAIAAGAIAAVWPALRAQRIDVLAGLRQDGRSASGRLRGGSTLMALEAALGVLLVVGAATTVASFGGMVFRYPGFDQQNLYDVRVNHGYDRTQGMRYLPVRVRRVLDTLRSTPGIESAGAVSLLTLGMQRRTGDAFWRDLGREGHRFGVSDGYFETIGTPLVAGRPFEPSDLDQAARVAVVSRSAVWRLWPGRSPSEVVGNQVDHLGAPLTVVGVVDDITSAPGEAPTPGLYLPMTLDDAPVGQSAVEVAIRVPSGTSPDLEAIRARLGQTMGPGSVSVESIADRTAPFLQRPRFQAVLFSTLAVIALVLASIGLYAVAAFDVARREHEMGIRLSLGATARDLRRAVIGSAVRPVAIGAAGGLVATWWAAQYLQSFLYEVDARSPWTYALVALVLVATAVIAAWLPARRAAKTDPAIVLRAV